MNRWYGLPNTSPLKALERKHAEGYLPRGWIDGLILSNDTTDATNDIAISAGVCRSTANVINGVPSTLSRDQVDMEIPVGIIKQLDVAWAPENYDEEGFSGGGRSGGRSPSSISDTTWHTFVIGGPGLPNDVLFHDSVTQSSVIAALPSGYTAYRRIGSVVRASSAIKAFTQFGDEFRWRTPAADFNSNPSSTSSAMGTLSVPIGVQVKSIITFSLFQSVSALGVTGYAVVNSPYDADNAASSSNYTNHIVSSNDSVNNLQQLADTVVAHIRTNTSGQIRYRLSSAAASLRIEEVTHGYIDSRDRDS